MSRDARCPAIEAPQQPVQRPRPSALPAREAIAQSLVPRGRGKQAVEQSAQVESCSANHYGKPRDSRQQRARAGGELAGGENLVGIDDVQHVMRNPAPLGFRQLGRADVEVAVDLERIAVHDFAAEFFAKAQG